MREPLVQTQVIPYLLEIQKDDIRTSLLTFESDFGKNGTRGALSEERARLAQKGIEWHALPYHKRPSALATAYDILRGAWMVRSLIRRQRFDILHGRVHVPTLMGAIGRKLSRHKPKLLFDIRGFFPEEYTDAGVWKENGLLYRMAKRAEKWLMRESDGFVVLTEKARKIAFPNSSRPDQAGGWVDRRRPVEVIPCCVDLVSRFPENNGILREAIRRRLGAVDRFVITHVGALGGLYLTKEIADLMAASKGTNPKTFGLFLTQSPRDLITQFLKERGFTESDYFVSQVLPEEVPEYLAASDVAVSFVKATFATQSRSPTKIAEYLACGVPVIANRGVGDLDQLIEEKVVGALIADFSTDAYVEALARIGDLAGGASYRKEVAKREFDLAAVGGERYRRLYQKMLSS